MWDKILLLFVVEAEGKWDLEEEHGLEVVEVMQEAVEAAAEEKSAVLAVENWSSGGCEMVMEVEKDEGEEVRGLMDKNGEGPVRGPSAARG